MDYLANILFQLVALMYLVHTGLAIKCYMCNSKQTPKCKSPFNAETSGLTPVDCVLDQEKIIETEKALKEVSNFMTKLGQDTEVNKSWYKNDSMVCQKLDIEVLGETITGRGCVYYPRDKYNPCDAISVIKRDQINVQSCTLCDSDGCNGAEGRRSSLLYILVTFVLFKFQTT